MSGPELSIPPAIAASLGMIIYELTTNAAKYGALSSSTGHVSIAWDLVDGSTISLKWHESGGPQVSEPTNQGFGTTFIRRSTEYELGGTAKFVFALDGLQV